MYSNQFIPPLGESIRQLRRQHSMTQTELGGEQFSKSYVSAVERDKIVPSYEALRFFANQLDQPTDYFENIYHQHLQLARQAEKNGASPVANVPASSSFTEAADILSANEPTFLDSFLLLLDTVLEHTELHPHALHQFTLSDELHNIVPLLPLQFQGRLAYLVGLQQIEKRDLSVALSSLEDALTLAPTHYHPAILDAIGMIYYLQKDYYIALNYHMRALRQLNERPASQVTREEEDKPHKDGTPASKEEDENALVSDLLARVYFHCGNAYAALGAHEKAVNNYEQAYTLLSPSVDIHMVGQLLQQLGYSTYAYANQQLSMDVSVEAVKEVESSFQRAISFLVQGRTIYQSVGERQHESDARLLQATILLDLSTWRRRAAEEQAKQLGKPVHINNASLLDEAEEQCRQILLRWLPTRKGRMEATVAAFATPSAAIQTYALSAMAHMILIFSHRTISARIGGYTDTERRELSLAAHYCQLLLNTLSEESFPWTLIHEMATVQRHNIQYDALSLPRIPVNSVTRPALALTDVYFAAGIVCETLGRGASHPDYIYDAYSRSDECIKLSLEWAQRAYEQKLVDVSYVMRCYQRSILILETREAAAARQEITIDGTLRSILKNGLQKLATPLL